MVKKKTAKADKKTAKGKAKTAKAKEDKTLNLIQSITSDINAFIDSLVSEEDIDIDMIGSQRRRLIGSGVKNYGFIEKALDIARDNPTFMPKFFNAQQMALNVKRLDEIRQLFFVVSKLQSLVSDLLLVSSDTCFREALRVYGGLRDLSRNKVPGARPLFEALLRFFSHRRRPGEEEPTAKELERDVHSLIKGTADGKIEIVNERPKVTRGVRKVVDVVNRGRAAVKEMAEADVQK